MHTSYAAHLSFPLKNNLLWVTLCHWHTQFVNNYTDLDFQIYPFTKPGNISPVALFQSTITLRALPRIFCLLHCWDDAAFAHCFFNFRSIQIRQWEEINGEGWQHDSQFKLQLPAAPVNCAFALLVNIWLWYGHIPLATWFVVQPVWIKYCSYSSWWNTNGNKNGKRIIWFNISRYNRISCIVKTKALVTCNGFIPLAVACMHSCHI